MKSASRKPQPKRKYFKSRGFSRLFCFSWEQRKAKELFVSTADKGYPELPVLSATQDRGMIRRDENSINIFHDKKNEAGYKRVLPGQFVIHLRSFQGGFAHSAIEGITSPAYTVFGFSEPEKHDSEYWKYVFTSKSFIRRLETVTYGIRDGRSISYEEFLTLGFVHPSKAEQTAIARYLDKLSDLITLHQRNSIGYIFKVRAYTNAWEQRKFEDAFIERREKTVTENEDTLLSCAINGMFLNSELFGHFRGTTTIGYLKVKKNDLILSAQNLHLGNANVNLRFEHGIISPAYKVYDLNNCEPEFVQAWVKKEDTKNFFLAATTEGASQCRKNIEWDTLGKQTICMPAIKEQATIGSFFKCVDHLITLHQRERKNRLFGGKNVKQYNFSRSVLQLLRAMDTRLQRRGCSQGDYG